MLRFSVRALKQKFSVQFACTLKDLFQELEVDILTLLGQNDMEDCDWSER